MTLYSIWVMEFAHVPEYHLSGLIYGAHNRGYRRLPYCYVVIKGQGQVAMVDVGYNHKEYGEVLANLYGGKQSEAKELLNKWWPQNSQGQTWSEIITGYCSGLRAQLGIATDTALCRENGEAE